MVGYISKKEGNTNGALMTIALVQVKAMKVQLCHQSIIYIYIRIVNRMTKFPLLKMIIIESNKQIMRN